MGSAVGNKTSLVDGAEGLETTIEIKIRTLDSQTYTLRVDKQAEAGATMLKQLPFIGLQKEILVQQDILGEYKHGFEHLHPWQK